MNSFFYKVKFLKEIGISPKFIPITIGYLAGTTDKQPSHEVYKELAKYYGDHGYDNVMSMLENDLLFYSSFDNINR